MDNFYLLLSRLFGIRQIQRSGYHRIELYTNKNPLGDKKRNERKKLKKIIAVDGIFLSSYFFTDASCEICKLFDVITSTQL